MGANFNQPEGQIEPSAFFDEEAEQVRQKFLEEQKEEEEAGEMALHMTSLQLGAWKWSRNKQQ